MANSLPGIMACLGLVLATNAIFVADWPRTLGGVMAETGLGAWLVGRVVNAGGMT